MKGVAAPLASHCCCGNCWTRARRGGGPEDHLDRPTQVASDIAQFTPLRQVPPPEVCPLVSHGRLDTGTSALGNTADLDSEVNFYWRHRQDSADGLEYRRLFVPLRKGEILAPEHWQESSLRACAHMLRGFFAEGATCSNTTFSYYLSLNRRSGLQRALAAEALAVDSAPVWRRQAPLIRPRTFPFRSQWLRGNPTCRVPVG